jgi:hypothetical protein
MAIKKTVKMSAAPKKVAPKTSNKKVEASKKVVLKKANSSKKDPGKGVFQTIKDTTAALKKAPAPKDSADWAKISRMRNSEALNAGIRRSAILNPKGYEEVLRLEKKMTEQNEKFKPANRGLRWKD